VDFHYDVRDRITQYTFIPADQAAEIRNTKVQYNDTLRQTTVTLPDGEKRRTSYSPFGLLLKSEQITGQNSRTLLVNESTDGQLVDTSKPYAHNELKTVYAYDSLGRAKTTTNSIGEKTQYLYANSSFVGTTSVLQETISTIDPDGKVTVSFANQLGFVDRVIEESPDKTRTTRSTYSAFGNLVKQEIGATGASLPQSPVQTTEYGYDGFGDLVYVKDAADQINRYIYNYQGLLASRLVNGESQNRNEYNELSWLLKTTDAPRLTKIFKKLDKACNCFVAGTKVQTDEGENIEDVQVGDRVLSKDEDTGEVGYKEVTATFNHETDEIYTIHVEDQTIESTYNHPFYVKDKGWTFAKDLKVEDLLVQSDGNTLSIKSIELLNKQAKD